MGCNLSSARPPYCWQTCPWPFWCPFCLPPSLNHHNADYCNLVLPALGCPIFGCHNHTRPPSYHQSSSCNPSCPDHPNFGHCNLCYILRSTMTLSLSGLWPPQPCICTPAAVTLATMMIALSSVTLFFSSQLTSSPRLLYLDCLFFWTSRTEKAAEKK